MEDEKNTLRTIDVEFTANVYKSPIIDTIAEKLLDNLINMTRSCKYEKGDS